MEKARRRRPVDVGDRATAGDAPAVAVLCNLLSLHAVYDALFARGVAGSGAAVQAAIAEGPRGVVTIRAAGRALVRWAVENPALAQLLYWRPVPGFAPTAATFAPSVRQMDLLRAAFAAAVQAGVLHPHAASEEAPRLFTIVLSGLISQQMANEPAAGYGTGMVHPASPMPRFDMFFARYALPGGTGADLDSLRALDQNSARKRRREQQAADDQAKVGRWWIAALHQKRSLPGKLLLRAQRACANFDPEHLLEVWGGQRATVRRGPAGIRFRRLGCPDPVRRLVRA